MKKEKMCNGCSMCDVSFCKCGEKRKRCMVVCPNKFGSFTLVIEDVNIVSLGNNRYEVSSTEGGTYIVDMNENSCECGQYIYRNECCRHLIAVREALGEVAEVDTIREEIF
ncbi:TPA: SWIM zinc finger family protein [Clostridium perfringens]|nr:MULTISPECIES: SWIM zinc finger family protein [Clostridium]MDU7016703.1 SWIM zinc finger family protein [Enterobacter sp.]EDT25749.1 swim zinc finger domain protein [Clostridium perfringens CPE str. F4969]MDK7591290.1 SWIM zinc finger family protein [Clostridium sp. UMB9555B]MEA5270718.1 SWIM zinc finger family protein [Clostridium perfringens]MEA5310976.1 SWIM zinc finger family protein [Clostridium perfringens]